MISSKRVRLSDDWNTVLDPGLDTRAVRKCTNISADVKKKTLANLSPARHYLVDKFQNEHLKQVERTWTDKGGSTTMQRTAVMNGVLFLRELQQNAGFAKKYV